MGSLPVDPTLTARRRITKVGIDSRITYCFSDAK
jgi:hypothetical protein